MPGYVDVLGIALGTNTVTVNSQSTYRKSEYFRAELPVNNSSSALWTNVSVSAVNETTVSGNRFVPKAGETFLYDQDGNLTNDGRWTFTWDGENRLVKVESLSATPQGSWRKVEWEYDGKVRRIRQKTSDKSSGSYVVTEDLKFLSDGWRHVAELNATNNNLIRSYSWGLDLSGSLDGAGLPRQSEATAGGVGGLLILNSAANGVHGYTYDGNGNVGVLVKLTDGSVKATYEYGPFSEVLRASGAMAGENRFQFSTKRCDRTTDLVLYEYRLYSPSTGRWPNRDPINEAGFNLLRGESRTFDLDEEKAIYCSVRNDPISRFDVLGLGLCAPLIWRTGCIEFVGCSTAQLNDFRVIPESKTGTMTTPSNGWNCTADGFGHKGNTKWPKVPGNCHARVTCSPGGGFSTSCCCNACLSAVRWVLSKAGCGHQPNSGKTSISPHNYPF